MKYNAKIYYTMDEEHPDMQYVNDWNVDKEYEYSDTYTFDEDIYNKEDEDMIIRYIKKDLKLVAGGGYDYKHIHNVKFKIIRV